MVGMRDLARRHARTRNHIQTLWSWFRSVEQRLHQAPEDGSLHAELERFLAAIDPRLSWEIGPVPRSRRVYFAVSPDLQHELLGLAQTVRDAAYESKLWRFLACRPAKPWNKVLQIDTGRSKPEHITLSGWRHVLLRYPDGQHEVLLAAPWAAGKPKKLRRAVAWIVVQNLLGERRVLESIYNVELTAELDEQFAKSTRPLRQLARAFGE